MCTDLQTIQIFSLLTHLPPPKYNQGLEILKSVFICCLSPFYVINSLSSYHLLSISI